MNTFDIEKSIGFLIAKVYQRGAALFKEEFDRFDLTPQQFSLLCFLWKEDGLSQAQLSSRTHIDRTTVGGLIDRLEKDGHVQRVSDPDDRRAYQIFLTQKGMSLRDAVTPAACRVRDTFASPLTESECMTLQSLLQKLRAKPGDDQ